MKKKPTPPKVAQPHHGGVTGDDGKRKDTEPRPQTRRRIRKIVERHRETFDELAK